MSSVPNFIQNDFISIPFLVEKIWTKSNHKKAVQSKAEKAHFNERNDSLPGPPKFPRLPPYASSIYIKMNQVPEQLRKWCHRDQEAKNQLEEFLQSEEWNVIQMSPKINQLKSNKKRIHDSIDKIRNLFNQIDNLDEFDSMTEQKYKKLRQTIDAIDPEIII